jgi:hypothetical protein
MEAQQLQRSTVEPPLECDEFKSELEILYGRMVGEVATVLRPFLSFARTFDAGKAHNMLALILDPRFKDLEVILKYVGHDVAKQVVDKFDSKVLVPLLLKAATILSPIAIVELVATADPLPARTKLFGAPTSTAEASKGLLLTELSLFRRLVVDPTDIACPLMWWKEQESRFPTVAYATCQFLGIPGSQIECERIFSIADILTALRHSSLGTTTLVALVMIQKNWPSDARTYCMSQANVIQFFNDEAELLELHEEELIAAGEFEFE